jgi:glycosyl transferase family 25
MVVDSQKQPFEEHRGMDIFVISLARATKRRSFILERLKELGLSSEVFDACTGENGYAPFFTDYNSLTYKVHSRREPMPGEIGCYASHMGLWKKCVELNRPIVILEDDARLTDELPRALQVSADLIEACGFIRLESCKQMKFPRRFAPVGGLDEFEVNYIYRVSDCMTGYVIAPEAAKRFIANSQTMLAPVDRFLQRPWTHEQPLYLLTPPSVVRQSGELGSDIKTEGASPRKDLSLGVLSSIIVLKSIYSLRRILFNATAGRRSRAIVRKLMSKLGSGEPLPVVR